MIVGRVEDLAELVLLRGIVTDLAKLSGADDPALHPIFMRAVEATKEQP